MSNSIRIQHAPEQSSLKAMGVFSWPIWEKEASTFPWTYDASETCYFLEGDVVVTPKDGEPMQMGAGDLVTFPSGMRCTWEIRKAVLKHYRFE